VRHHDVTAERCTVVKSLMNDNGMPTHDHQHNTNVLCRVDVCVDVHRCFVLVLVLVCGVLACGVLVWVEGIGALLCWFAGRLSVAALCFVVVWCRGVAACLPSSRRLSVKNDAVAICYSFSQRSSLLLSTRRGVWCVCEDDVHEQRTGQERMHQQRETKQRVTTFPWFLAAVSERAFHGVCVNTHADE